MTIPASANPSSAPAPPGRSDEPGEGTRPAPPDPPRVSRPGSEAFQANLGEDVQLRLRLQRRSQVNRLRHLQHTTARWFVLLTADLAMFAAMRGLLRAVRDRAVLGPGIADLFSTVLPPGYLSGWQFAAALVIALLVTGNYGPGDRRHDAGRLFFGCALATALPLWMELWTRGLGPTVVQYTVTTALIWFGLVGGRLVVHRAVLVARAGRRDSLRAVFVGRAEDCRRVTASSAFRDAGDFTLSGFVDSSSPPASDALGSLNQLPVLLHRRRAEAVVVCGSLSDVEFEMVVDTALAGGCRLISVPKTFAIAGITPRVVWRSGQPIVELTGPSLRAEEILLKRAIDVTASVIGLAVLSPVYALVAALVKLDSAGPVFFAQARVGQGGRVFRIYKFRSMRQDAEQQKDELQSASMYEDPRLFKVLDDPRVTRVGRWLRRTSLDELPQLWNVLRGDMSLVGPRPPLPSEVSLYEWHHYARFEVKPGITGPWQVNGRNDVKDFEQVVVLETDYIRRWTIWSDVAILLRTIPTVLRMRGAH